MLKNILSPDFINAILRASTPILFATLASAIASKSGITNMALEGMLLFSALFGVIFSSLTHSFLGGLLITMVIGGLIGFFLAFFILQLKTDEILAAIALNLIATGGTVLLMLAVSGDRGASTSISSVSAPTVYIPMVAQIPFLGKVLSGQNLMTWLSLIAVVVVHIFLYKTPMGLKIRAVGENEKCSRICWYQFEKNSVHCTCTQRHTVQHGRLLPVRRIHEHVYKRHVCRKRIYCTGGKFHGG